jgi:hypothetical protein
VIILSKIDDAIDRLLSSSAREDVGFETTAGRITTVSCGQEVYEVSVTVKLKKVGTDV